MIKGCIQMGCMDSLPCFYVFWRRKSQHIFWLPLMQGKQLSGMLHIRNIKVEDRKHHRNYPSSSPYLKIYSKVFKFPIINWNNMRQMILSEHWLPRVEPINGMLRLFPGIKTSYNLLMSMSP